ncbi:hypothetical protein HDV05_001842 [Chytridiales sp. JEL 0842]|nr:hypothetical protein HDV05_001842 [Chytridiales sp. JEL 0842]
MALPSSALAPTSPPISPTSITSQTPLKTKPPPPSSPQWTSYLLLLLSCLAMSTSGSVFSFSLISRDLMSALQLSSTDINLISGLANTSVYISFLWVGPFYDRFGSAWTLMLATVLSTLGNLIVWLAYVSTSPAGEWWKTVGALGSWFFVGGIGATGTYMAAIGFNLTRFGTRHMGKVTAILLLFYGLSGIFYAQVYAGFYKGNTGGYLLFVALSAGAINLAAWVGVGLLGGTKDEGGDAPKETVGDSRSGYVEGIERPEMAMEGAYNEDGAKSTFLPMTHQNKNDAIHLRQDVSNSDSDDDGLPSSVGSIPQLFMHSRAASRRSLHDEARTPRRSLRGSTSLTELTRSSVVQKEGFLERGMKPSARSHSKLLMGGDGLSRPSSVGLRESREGGFRVETDEMKEKLLSRLFEDNSSYGKLIDKTPDDDNIKNEEQEMVYKGAEEVEESEASGVMDILKSPTFWMYTATFTFQQGITYISNLSEILTAANLSTPSASPSILAELATKTSTHVTLLSLSQSLGRLSFGLLPDILPRSNPFLSPTSLFLLSQLILLLPLMVLAGGTSSDAGLIFCSLTVGYGFGAAGALFPQLTREYFGSKVYVSNISP